MTLEENLNALRTFWFERDDHSPMKETAIAELDAAIAIGDPIGNDEMWLEYFERLQGPDACNFQDDNGNVTWTCGGGMDKSFSEKILRELGYDNAKIAEVHALVNVLGGHCDCEIIFNAAERIVPLEEGQ